MAEQEITNGNTQLLEIAKKNKSKVLMLDFGASWCAPCRSINPLLHQLSQQYENNLVLCKIDVDLPENQDLCDAYKVNSLPSLVWIQQMNILKRIEGADKEAIKKICQTLC